VHICVRTSAAWTAGSMTMAIFLIAGNILFAMSSFARDMLASTFCAAPHASIKQIHDIPKTGTPGDGA
jgi:hypothetical protein